MCGIAGIVGKSANIENAKWMSRVLAHRGPDQEGYFHEGRIALGHRRLSIIDLSEAGKQPFYNDDKSLVLVFNGEIYNYLEIRKELNKKYQFRSKTDTEVLLYAYQEWGIDCLSKFIGMFAFAIYDKKRDLIFCARDRIGKKPLFYYKDNENFFFASEIKALLSIGVPRIPNYKIIYDYLYYGYYDHTNETFFKDIFSLPQGHYFLIKDNNFTIKKYWEVGDRLINIKFKREKSLISKFKELIIDSLSLRLRSDTPIGVTLSGGLDSSSLMAIIDQLFEKKDTIFTYSIFYKNPIFSEEMYINEMADFKEWTNYNIRISHEDIKNHMLDVLRSQDQPYAGVPTIAYAELMKKARKNGCIVLLEGQGMDEMVGGYKYYYGAYILDLIFKGRLLAAYNELKAIKIKRINIPSFLIKAILNVYFHRAQDGTKPTYTKGIKVKFFRKFKKKLKFKKKFKSILLNMMFRDFKYTKIPRVMRFNDHLSMASSIELRSPYLDYRLADIAFSLDPKMKLRNGEGKYILREVMEGYLPELIRKRPKQFLSNPQIVWFRRELKQFIEKILKSDTFLKRPFLNKKKVIAKIENFFKFGSKNSFFILQWVILELWFREYIDPKVWKPRATNTPAKIYYEKD